MCISVLKWKYIWSHTSRSRSGITSADQEKSSDNQVWVVHLFTVPHQTQDLRCTLTPLCTTRDKTIRELVFFSISPLMSVFLPLPAIISYPNVVLRTVYEPPSPPPHTTPSLKPLKLKSVLHLEFIAWKMPFKKKGEKDSLLIVRWKNDEDGQSYPSIPLFHVADSCGTEQVLCGPDDKASKKTSLLPSWHLIYFLVLCCT